VEADGSVETIGLEIMAEAERLMNIPMILASVVPGMLPHNQHQRRRDSNPCGFWLYNLFITTKMGRI
jgi:hypothetical protein